MSPTSEHREDSILGSLLSNFYHKDGGDNFISQYSTNISFCRNLLSTNTSDKDPIFSANFSLTNWHGQRQIKSIWEKSLQCIIEDFLARKEEILLLNPGRKSQIEAHIATFISSGSPASLHTILTAKPGSAEHQGLLRFAWETSTIQFFQFLLLKRWVSQGQLPESVLLEGAQKMNWQIATHLRSSNPQKLLSRNHWSFLKISIYSWYKISSEAWCKLIQYTSATNLAEEPADFLCNLFRDFEDVPKVQTLGLNITSLYSKLAWEILLYQKCLDECIADPKLLKIGKSKNNSLFIQGAGSGHSLISLLCLGQDIHYDGTYLFARDDFEHFLAEICFLWAIGKKPIPSAINIQSAQRLNQEEINKPNNVMPLVEPSLPCEISFSIIFPDFRKNNQVEFSDAIQSLDRLQENGSLLMSSETYWITDRTPLAQDLRIKCLSQAALRLIIDLRHLNSDPRFSLPKCIFLFEKHSSKEYRDSNRPKLIKARGNVHSLEEMEQVWQIILDSLACGDNPGEVKNYNVGQGIQKIRLEVMSAATNQAHLGAAPWNSLSEPSFYQISSKLKLFPLKSHQQGFLLRPQKSQGIPLRKGVHFLEVPGKALYAGTDGSDTQLSNAISKPVFSKAQLHFFLPETSIKESPAFFAAMINSSPIQFWYRLEWEQNCFSGKKTIKNADSILKLMPLTRILPPNALLPAEILQGSPLESLDLVHSIIPKLARHADLGLEDSFVVHKCILDLEATIAHHLSITREYCSYLHPGFDINRWNIPERLPDISPEHAISTLQHMQQAQLRQHPSIHCSPLKNVSDFKISETKVHLGTNGLSDIILYCGPEAMMRVHGPTLLIDAANSSIKKRLQRSWLEVSQKITFPIDSPLMFKQLDEFSKLSQKELETTLRAAHILDFIFCRLFDLDSDGPSHGDAQIIRHHLVPTATTIATLNKQRSLFSSGHFTVNQPKAIPVDSIEIQ